MYKRSLHDNRDIPKKKKFNEVFLKKSFFAIPAGKAVSAIMALCACVQARTPAHKHICTYL